MSTTITLETKTIADEAKKKIADNEDKIREEVERKILNGETSLEIPEKDEKLRKQLDRDVTTYLRYQYNNLDKAIKRIEKDLNTELEKNKLEKFKDKSISSLEELNRVLNEVSTSISTNTKALGKPLSKATKLIGKQFLAVALMMILVFLWFVTSLGAGYSLIFLVSHPEIIVASVLANTIGAINFPKAYSEIGDLV